jgi:hypothetical protein
LEDDPSIVTFIEVERANKREEIEVETKDELEEFFVDLGFEPLT